jgi:Family of unknown function (DUF6455)
MATSRFLWPMLEQAQRRENLIESMTAASGVDVLAAIRVDGGLAQARTMCRYCLHEGACRNWLESFKELKMPPDFCPNAGFFLAYRREESVPSPRCA